VVRIDLPLRVSRDSGLDHDAGGERTGVAMRGQQLERPSPPSRERSAMVAARRLTHVLGAKVDHRADLAASRRQDSAALRQRLHRHAEALVERSTRVGSNRGSVGSHGEDSFDP
jgi:hypothetical protein